MKSKVCQRADCFAWTQPQRYRNSCTALEDVVEWECPFYKSRGQMKDERDAMRLRAEFDDAYRAALAEYGIVFKKRGRGRDE